MVTKIEKELEQIATDLAIYVSPSEPASLRDYYITSSAPEKYGVDILFATIRGLIGVQRKTPEDFVASVRDGRIGKQTALADELHIKAIFIEGYPIFTSDGEIVNRYARFTANQWYAVLFSLRQDGWWIVQCRDRSDLIHQIELLRRWSIKKRHGSLNVRPGPNRDSWGRTSNRKWGVHVLTSLPGVGQGTAENIYDRFKRVPLRWDELEKDILQVKGVGMQTWKKMCKFIKSMEEE